VFGPGKEIDKLATSCRKHKDAEGLLLVYCEMDEYARYLPRVAEQWMSSVTRQRSPPSLFLHTVIFHNSNGVRELDRLRTVEINPEEITIWNDLLL
jgi:hypothetical protein